MKAGCYRILNFHIRDTVHLSTNASLLRFSVRSGHFLHPQVYAHMFYMHLSYREWDLSSSVYSTHKGAIFTAIVILICKLPLY